MTCSIKHLYFKLVRYGNKYLQSQIFPQVKFSINIIKANIFCDVELGEMRTPFPNGLRLIFLKGNCVPVVNMAKISVTLTIVINISTRELLAGETNAFFV